MVVLSRAENLLPDLKIPLWYNTVDLRGSLGYNDNVLLSPAGEKGSAFWASGLDLIVFRLPTRGWQFSFFLSGEDVRYFRNVGVEGAQNLLASAQLTKDLGHGWKAGAGTLYSYQDQVFDVSATEATNVITRVLGNGIGGRLMLRQDFETNWAELEFLATRQYFDQPLDSFWQGGPRLTLGHNYGQGSSFSLSHQVAWVQYDTRPQIADNGVPVPNSHLAFMVQTVEGVLRHNWDVKRHWRTETKLGLEVNQDNGPGFFDSGLYRVSQKLGYYARTWEVSGQARIGHYDFPNQPVSSSDLSKREKTYWGLNLHAQKNLTKHLKVFGDFSHEQSLSNLGPDNYRVNVVSGGADWQF